MLKTDLFWKVLIDAIVKYETFWSIGHAVSYLVKKEVADNPVNIFKIIWKSDL